MPHVPRVKHSNEQEHKVMVKGLRKVIVSKTLFECWERKAFLMEAEMESFMIFE